MTNGVGFLDELEQDLVEAARREAAWGRASGRGPALRPTIPGGRPSGRMIAALVAAFLVVAGVVGYFVTRGGPSQVAVQTRAVGAPAGAARQAPIVHGAAPAPSAQRGSLDTAQGEIPAGTAGTAFAPISGGASAPSQPEVAGSILVGPEIIKTADLSVVVPKGRFEQGFAAASAVASKYGGFVETSSTGGSPARFGTLQIRVPAADFDRALNDLRGLGTIDSQTIQGQDVTAKYVDLQARIRTWESQETALIRLMGKTTTVGQTLEVQAQLQRVQLTIEQLKGQVRVLNDQTAKATISVSLHEQGAPVAKPKAATVKNPSLGTGVRRAVAGFFGVVVAVLVGLGYLVPVTVLLALLWLVFRRVRAARVA